MQKEVAEVTRQRISEALFVIGFGVIWAFDLWWPGILVAFGAAWAAGLAIGRKYWASAVVGSLLCVVPVAYIVLPAWDGIVPLLVVAVGLAGLARAFRLRSKGQVTN